MGNISRLIHLKLVPNSTTNKMTVGFAKHLVGNFSGSTISWTTNTTTSIYLEKIWLVG